jgi:hypothetical protein
MMARPLATIRAGHEEMMARLEAKIDMMNTKLDAHQGEMKAQVGSLTSQINANQEEMKAMLDACLEKMAANPGEQKFIAVHGKVPKETDRVPNKRHRGRHLATALEKSEGMDPGRLWILEEIGCHQQEDDLLYRSDIVQGTRASGARQGRFEQETQKGWMLGKRQQTCQEGNKGIKDLGSRWLLYVKKGRTTANSSIGGWSRRQQL